MSIWDALHTKLSVLANAAVARAEREAQQLPGQIAAEVGKQLDEFFTDVLADINSDLRDEEDVSDDSDSE